MKYIFFLFSAIWTHLFSSNIFVIGDSHTKEFEGIPGLYIHYLGARTMHRIGRDQLNVLNLKNYNINNQDHVVFVFGEIDVRCHIGRQRDLKNRDLDEIMHTLISAYLETILKNRAQFENLTCIVYGITPPTDTIYSHEYPRYGSLEERIKITKQMNQLLQCACLKNGIKFLDVYNDFADQSGALIPEFSDGNVHIGSQYNEPIKTKLYELL